MKRYIRRLPVGAECSSDGVHFRVWAPARTTVEVVLDGGETVPLQAEDLGYFSGVVTNARAGSRYKYLLDGGEAFPDPASRFQPEGPQVRRQLSILPPSVDRPEMARRLAAAASDL